MRGRSMIAGLILAAFAASSARADLALDVAGGNPEARRVVSNAAREWYRRGEAREASREFLAWLGRALVLEGWGKGEISAAFDSLGGGSHRCTIELGSLEPSRLAGWTWEPPEIGPAVKPGPWNPAEQEARLWDLVGRKQEGGRPFASVQVLEARNGEGGMTVRARLREGPLLSVRSVVFEGKGATRQRFLERLSGLIPGEPVRPSRAGMARDRIERSGLFSRVEGPWLRSPEGGEATLVYRMVAAPQNHAEGAVGYDGTRRSLSGFVRVELGNLFGTGRRLDAAWERYEKDRSSLNLAYREPYLLGLPLAAEAALSQEIEDSTWTVDDARGVIEGDFGRGLTARIGVATHRTVASGNGGGRTRSILTIAGVGFDGRTEAGTRGGRSVLGLERGELRRSPMISGANGTLLKLNALSERSQPVGGQALIRVEVSGAWVQGPDSLPRLEAAGLGGSGNLRGHPERVFRALRYGLMRIEAGARMLPEGNRAYVFFDGALYRPWPRGATKRASAYGVGFRVRGGGGWVRLDYGIPAGEPPLSGRIHFRLETKF